MRQHKVLSLLTFAALAKLVHASPVKADSGLSAPVERALRSYCYSCHNDKKAKGEVRLDNYLALDDKSRLALLNRVQEQLHFNAMPPEDAKQPSVAEKKLLTGWVRSELTKSNAPLIEDKLHYPDYGNAVDHERLFSGEIKEKPYGPARRWLVSPQIFNERVLDALIPSGNGRDGWRNGFYGVTNPFILPDRPGVRDYAISLLDGGHLLVMLTNAQWISQKQIRAARVKNGEIKADFFENPKDKWSPATTPAAFESIILSKAKPDDKMLADAVQTQFNLVLQRPPGEAELVKYLSLTRGAIDLAGNTEGLRQMLVAVLLESEFLYRLEFGAGAPDEFGRRKLSPREASYAISYALGDRNPDPALTKAAAEGRLNSNEDYRREVLRLLADQNYYRGPIDPAINDSPVTSHPKIIRFFREFFGYPNALKVFKDKNRSGGYYDNPGRGSSATPGRLVREADKMVEYFVQQDKQVFEQLLTTDQYFVYHNVDNEKGQKIIAAWKEVYETLKDTEWKTNPEKVFAEHQELCKKNGINLVKNTHSNDLQRVMTYFTFTFGKGNTPFTTFPWAHGYSYWHSASYNMGGTPGSPFRGSENYDDKHNLNYPVVQPFKIANRKGVLTHPAWLIAQSSNFHTDPIRRGRWIREKLLAGRVPDVPITVDAKVPEEPHMTLRERVESVTSKPACANCHSQMNPLGYAFEKFDDFGRYRADEPLENPENLIAKAKGKYDADTYKTKPVDTSGYLSGTGDARLDGPVRDAFDLIDRLGKSDRARQSIIRHAFRFYMGRNETLADSQTLIEADKAYLASGGSFRAVIVSLLSSDSFMYRK
jgi:hypothetical protein